MFGSSFGTICVFGSSFGTICVFGSSFGTLSMQRVSDLYVIVLSKLHDFQVNNPDIKHVRIKGKKQTGRRGKRSFLF